PRSCPGFGATLQRHDSGGRACLTLLANRFHRCRSAHCTGQAGSLHPLQSTTLGKGIVPLPFFANLVLGRRPQIAAALRVCLEEFLMMRRNGVMFLFVAVATFLAFASSASAGMRGLTTTIESQQNFVGAADDVALKVTYTNSSREDIYLLRWQTALKGLDEN